MTKALSLKAGIVSTILVLVALAVLAAQYVGQMLQQALADSAGIRVAAANTCDASDTHFTGCSSIL